MATDFFEQQDIARRRTGLLIAYFVLALIAIVASVYAAATGIALATAKGQTENVLLLDWVRLTAVVIGVGLVVVLGSLYKMAALHEGGAAVARLMGGQVVNPGAATPAERRLLNVVEEMAIASGTPVPTVYVLPDESSINAFAAGHEPGDAVVAVSQGSLDHLTRDELQGVVAHEFSHILNGDMRLNLRLISLLHGILLLALIGQMTLRILGRSQPRSRSNRKDNSGGVIAIMLAMGVALLVIGWVGVFFGRLIKAAISRQREFLADASAVQFTRNPDGIVGALKKIGGLPSGSRIASPNAEQASHMFFGAGVPFLLNAFSTHPPLVERIKRLDPSFDGTFPAIAAEEVVVVSDDEEKRAGVLAGFAAEPGRPALPRPWNTTIPLDPGTAVSSIGAPRREHVAYATGLIESLPPALAATVREPFGARAIVYALLLSHDSAVRRRQLEIIDNQSEPGTAAVVDQFAPMIDSLDPAARLPLADLAMPALRQLSAGQYRSFRDRIDPLINADRKVSLFEFALKRMLLRHLDRHFDRRPPDPVRFSTLEPLRENIGVLLTRLAHLDRPGPEQAVRAFNQGVLALGSREIQPELLPPERLTLSEFERALDRLALASPSIKRRLLDACAACIVTDGRVTLAEGELLRAIADSLDCPMPPLLASAAVRDHGPPRAWPDPHRSFGVESQEMHDHGAPG